MFSLFKKGRQIPGTTGIAVTPDGVAVAHCIRRNNEPPRLTLCAHRALAADNRGRLLQPLLRELQVGDSSCVSVADSSAFTLLLVEAPQVEPAELRAAVRWRVKDLLDFHVDDAVIDVFDIPGQQERGRPKLMYVVAARVSTIRQHIDLLEGNGVTLSAIDIPELCQRNIAALLPEDASGVAVLHLGADGGLLTLTRQGVLYLCRSLEVGAAELAAAAPAMPEMTPELARLMDSVVLEVQRSLDYYESHFSLPPVSALAVVPTAQPVPGLIGHLAANLGLPVRVLDLNGVIASDRPLTDQQQSACFRAIGAALRREEKAL